MSYIGNSSTLYDPTRSSPKTAQVFSGNGSTTTFNLTYGVATSSDIQVMVENVVQQPDYAYTATGQVLTFSAAPNPGTNNIYVVYNRTAGLTGSVSDGSISSSKLANNIRLLATDQFLGTGSTTQFALSDIPADANSLIVSINGVLQAAPANYTIAGNILTFSSAPLLNENIIIRNVGFRTSQTLYALGANTPIVQPVITGGSHTLAGTLTATGNVSLLSASGATYTANIGGSTGNLIVQSANTNVSGNLSVGGSLTVATGGGIIPVGGIIMWSGSIASIPSGWQLCNGTNGTPDLRNQFVVGAGSTYPVANTGGTADAIVVSHTHTATVTDPGHSHAPASGNFVNTSGTDWRGVRNDFDTYRLSQSTATASAVTSISVTNATAGTSGTNQNLPPYYALAYIMKL
jgi:hypothetical protein